MAGELFCAGLTFADLADTRRLPQWLAFLHDPGPWEIPCDRGVATFEPLTLLIASRAIARALNLHEHDRVALAGDPVSPRLRLGGVAAALYAGAALVGPGDDPTVVVTPTSVRVEGEAELSFVGWCETNGLAALSPSPDRLGNLLERMEADVREGELVVRGPLVMSGYRSDPKATAAAFDGGWLHTGQAARLSAEGEVVLA